MTTKPRECAERELGRMVESIRHESFYATGTWMDESLGVYVGWAGLQTPAISGLPLRSERGDRVLVFFGDDYSSSGSSDRSYFLDLLEKEPDFPAGLNGRFHGLSIDRVSGVATLFNDRYGMQQLVYHEGKDAFYFAAEAKAILAVRPELRSVDPRAMGELVCCGCAMEGRTLFTGIDLLPPGSAWTFRNGALEKKGRYFGPESWEQQPTLTGRAYYDEIRRCFSENLGRYFVSSQPIGVSLTGGLDTRMIMAWQRSAPGSLPCYTFGGTYRECRDVAIARRVARVSQQPHEVITVGKDFLSRFPYFAERTVYLTDGRADVGRAPALYANMMARDVAPVRMTGVYGSEILRRLRNFKPGAVSSGVFNRDFLVHTDAARDAYSRLVKLHPVSFTAFNETPQRAVDALEQSQLEVRYPFLDNEVVRTAFRAAGTSFAQSDVHANNDVCLNLIADGNPELGRIPSDRGFSCTPDGIGGAMSRAFLDFTFKAEYAYDYGMPQAVARIDKLLSAAHIERMFLGRHKFAHFRIWYRDALAGYVREILLDRRTLSRPYVERSGVEQIVSHHLKGDRNYTTEIHRLLTLELTHRLLVDAK